MSRPSLANAAGRIYDAIYEEEDARVCKDISDSACSNVPRNFFLNATAIALGKLGDAVANTKTTLPWLLTSVGTPGWILSALVPIRESGSMLPQLAIGGRVRKAPRRKWFYVGGAIVQALALCGVAFSVLLLEGTTAGLTALTGVVVFSLARGFCSVASKDVMGKTVPRTRRGRLNGLAASVAGFGTLIVAVILYQLQVSEQSFSVLVLAAAALWIGAAACYAHIDEEPGTTEGGVNGLAQAVSSLRLLLDDEPFRNFVFGRALLVGTALTAPFIVIMARERSDAELLFFLLAQGSASLLSSPFWGKFADRSSKSLLLVCGIATGLLGLGLFFIDRVAPEVTSTSWFLPTCFFLLMVIHDGVRLGRKTYLLDLGGTDKRIDYVAVSNTTIGIILLGAGVLASFVQTFGNAVAIAFFSVLALVACLFVRRLPEVQQ